jgi:hypothetical protein
MSGGDSHNRNDFLIGRLEAIGASLEQAEGSLALIGLGSVGLERHRLDEFSDLDFFVIVQPGYKARFIDTLDWLSCIAKVDYYFRNTIDGYKLLYADGIFCEFAVFEPHELDAIPFSPGVMVWQREGVPDAYAIPTLVRNPQASSSEEWLIGEALTCLYVGLNRYRRGELLSAQRFIQNFAVDRLLELIAMKPPATIVSIDSFVIERRFEQRYPASSELLSKCVQGYDRNAESAIAMLDYLVQHFDVNPAIARRIRALAEG